MNFSRYLSALHLRPSSTLVPARLATALLCSASSLIFLLAQTACGTQERLNLVVITLDTTRADHIGTYGRQGAATQNIDALAVEGTVLENHLVPVPLTLPSHTSLFTGRFPPTHTVRDNGIFSVPEEEITLAEILQAAGYQTSGFPASFPLHSRFGIDQGFDFYDDGFLDQDRGRRKKPSLFFEERPAAAVVRSAISHLRQRNPKRPFFSFLHFFDPHQPMQPAPPFDVQFRGQPYDGEIAAVDFQIGRFFAFLKKEDLWDNTIILVTADHGEGLGEHGEITHALLLHQATLHVPGVLAGPGVPKGLRTSEWTNSTDILATLLELLGIDPPTTHPAIGDSLMPLLRNGGKRSASMPRFTSYFETIAPQTTQGWAQLAGYMRDDWRLIHGPNERLHNLVQDPGEHQNLVLQEQRIAEGLRSGLRDFLQHNESGNVAAKTQELDEETRRRLAGLGYLHGGNSDPVVDFLDFGDREDPYLRAVDVSIFSQAKSATIEGKNLLARSLWEKVLERSPENVAAYQGMARLYGQAGDIEQAVAWAQSGFRAIPTAFSLLEFAGQLLIEAGSYEAGIEHLLALPNVEESVDACTWLGWAYREQGDLEQAETWLRRGISLRSKNQWMDLYLANLLSRQERFDEAESIYQRLIHDHPFFTLGHYNYGQMLVSANRHSEALQRLERAVQVGPQHVASQQLLQQQRAHRQDRQTESKRSNL